MPGPIDALRQLLPTPSLNGTKLERAERVPISLPGAMPTGDFYSRAMRRITRGGLPDLPGEPSIFLYARDPLQFMPNTIVSYLSELPYKADENPDLTDWPKQRGWEHWRSK